MSIFRAMGGKWALKVSAAAASCVFAISVLANETTTEEQAKQDKAVARALRKIDSAEPLNSGDRAALKAAARKMNLESLRVCADPGNMPLSNIRGEGYENKIVEILAAAMNTHLSYYWLPYIERGFIRQTFGSEPGNANCDVLLDLPVGYEDALLSEPIYKTTYVFAYRADHDYNIKSLDDPRLKQLKIGVYETSGIRQVFKERGIDSNVIVQPLSRDADLKPDHQPSYQIQEVIDGKLDIAAVWGPFAGYYKAIKKAPVVIQPVNLMENRIPLEFELGLGVQAADRILKYKIDLALEEKKAEIEKVLREYGVPLVQCSDCIVAGDLPAHGEYSEALNPTPASELKSPVTLDQLKSWLAAGADVNEEFDNAVTAGALDRATYLLDKGADPNKPDGQGGTPLNNAILSKNLDLIKLLLDHHANVNAPDSDGMTPLLEAITQDDSASIKVLAARGAHLEDRTSDGVTSLALAIVENRLEAALALIDAGAPVNTPSGKLGLTPLMIVAGKPTTEMSLQPGRHEIENFSLDPHYPDSLRVARALVDRKADVNAVSASGVTALMLAAAHNNPPIVGLLLQSGADPNKQTPDKKTALDLATENGNDTVINLIRLMQQSHGR